MLTWGKTIILTTALLVAVLVNVLFVPECRAEYKWHRGMMVPVTRYNVNTNKSRRHNYRRSYHRTAVPRTFANYRNDKFKLVRKARSSNPYFNRNRPNPYFRR